ncbi:hypothetical protein CONPUDRAFT_151748 [Coniophora puteana RWD-64-598 SS2]|uniref:Uncharacterized protein n=1 Tax=Coniophora puteana (strain RWD-64-598) TaxID=741705 RepID=A0A5M3MU84_CONPW|nr:uncharacterized protein CONPUDRAFT_151748 [Coniophora puteana RWD-64-598 SS2]EIW82689.1 hypothetical protein CONPUDRAFT_151748 [Coniophora puteana RWD-64-598 SS2]
MAWEKRKASRSPSCPSHKKHKSGDTQKTLKAPSPLKPSKGSHQRKAVARKKPKTRATVGPIKSKSLSVQCLRLGRVLARTGSSFSDVDTVLQLGVYRSLKGAGAYGDLSASSEIKQSWKELSKGWRKWHVFIYDFVKEHCPAIFALLKRANCLQELQSCVEDIRRVIGRTRNEDYGSCKANFCLWAADDPDYPIQSLVGAGSSRDDMGFNHDKLARLLRPAIYLQEFDENPAEVARQMAEGTGDWEVTADWFPAFVWKDCAYNPNNVGEGMFEHPVFLRALKRVFLGPQAATAKKRRAVKQRSNAALMETFTLRFAPSQQPQWGVTADGEFVWEDAHNNLLEFLWRQQNKPFVEALIKWFNIEIFGHPKGRRLGRSSRADSDKNGTKSKRGDLFLLAAQLEAASSEAAGDATTDIKMQGKDLDVDVDQPATVEAELERFSSELNRSARVNAAEPSICVSKPSSTSEPWSTSHKPQPPKRCPKPSQATTKANADDNRKNVQVSSSSSSSSSDDEENGAPEDSKDNTDEDEELDKEPDEDDEPGGDGEADEGEEELDEGEDEIGEDEDDNEDTGEDTDKENEAPGQGIDDKGKLTFPGSSSIPCRLRKPATLCSPVPTRAQAPRAVAVYGRVHASSPTRNTRPKPRKDDSSLSELESSEPEEEAPAPSTKKRAQGEGSRGRRGRSRTRGHG